MMEQNLLVQSLINAVGLERCQPQHDKEESMRHRRDAERQNTITTNTAIIYRLCYQTMESIKKLGKFITLRGMSTNSSMNGVTTARSAMASVLTLAHGCYSHRTGGIHTGLCGTVKRGRSPLSEEKKMDIQNLSSLMKEL